MTKGCGQAPVPRTNIRNMAPDFPCERKVGTRGIRHKGAIMPRSQNVVAMATGLSRCLAGTALMVGVAFGSAAVASAEPEWDIEVYDKCMAKTVRSPAACCLISGGEIGTGSESECHAPTPLPQIEEAPGGRTLPPVPPDSNMPTLTGDPAQPIA